MIKKRFPSAQDALAISGRQVSQDRVRRGQARLAIEQEHHVELRKCYVADTPADGICFLHAIKSQLALDDCYSVWDIALSFVQWMGCRQAEWGAYVDNEFMSERLLNLEKNGVRRMFERHIGQNAPPFQFYACLYL